MEAFRRGTYQFGLRTRVPLRDGETVALWSSADALVIKILPLILQARLQPLLSRACYHLKGHGDLKGAVREVPRTGAVKLRPWPKDVPTIKAPITGGSNLLR